MTGRERAMAEKNLDLIFEFERYVLAHPRVADRIPEDAVLVFQVKDDDAFNRWSRRVARRQAKDGRQPMMYVTIKKMGPVRSRITGLKIQRAA